MSSHKIMVIDDEPDILAIIKMSLQKCKYPIFVEAYPNPFVALEKFRQDPGSYSLVLTDIRMPNMNGFQLARYVQDVRDVPVVFMTAFVLDQNLPGFGTALMNGDVIQKPEGLLDLCDALMHELAKVI